MKYAKIVDVHTVTTETPTSAVIDGCPVGNISGNSEYLAKLGFFPLVEVAKPEGNYRAVYSLADGRVLQSWEAYTPEPEVVDYDKLKIIETLISIGKLDEFKASLTLANQELFSATPVIRSTNQWFISAIGDVAAGLGLSAEEVAGLLAGCKQ